jgi:hypothetical protein
LKSAIASSKTIGYKRKLESGKIFYPKEKHQNEMILTQVKLLSQGNGGSFAAFSSFEPTDKGCGSAGYGYMHLVDSFTGLPKPETHSFFYTSTPPPGAGADQVTGVQAIGEGMPTEAFVHATEGGVIIKASDSEAGSYGIFIPKEQAGLSGTLAWREVLDNGLGLTKEEMSKDLNF